MFEFIGIDEFHVFVLSDDKQREANDESNKQRNLRDSEVMCVWQCGMEECIYSIVLVLVLIFRVAFTLQDVQNKVDFSLQHAL